MIVVRILFFVGLIAHAVLFKLSLATERDFYWYMSMPVAVLTGLLLGIMLWDYRKRL